jgi:hypothetical protein
MATFFRTPWKAHESYGENAPPIPKPDRRRMPRTSKRGPARDDRGPSSFTRTDRPQGARPFGDRGGYAPRGPRSDAPRGPRSDSPRSDAPHGGARRSWTPEFVIGTPGRLKDLMERRALDLSRTSATVVLDEADRMLDMGFIDDMRFILAKMPKKRHTLFFSATMSREIEKLIGDFLNDPVRISVKTRDTSRPSTRTSSA